MSLCRHLPRHFDDGAQAALNEIPRPFIAKHSDCIVSRAMAWSDLPDAQRFQTLDNRLDLGITSAAQVKASHQQIDVLAKIRLSLLGHIGYVGMRAARDHN